MKGEILASGDFEYLFEFVAKDKAPETKGGVGYAVGGFGLLLLFWLLDWSGAGAEGGALAYLSLQNHYEPFLRGVFDTRDVAYLLLFIITFLALTVRRLDMDRLGG